MDFDTAKRILKTPIVRSFAKTKFRNAQLRRASLDWAINLPKGSSHKDQVESIYYTTYNGSEIRFGKPGKEAFWPKKPNKHDMTPILYEKRNNQLKRSEKTFSFVELWKEIRTKILADREAGQVLFAMLYRSGVLDDHEFSKGKFCYVPNEEIMRWLDRRFKAIGESPTSELIPLYDAIMLNEDIKIYTNPERYQSSHMKPYEKRGRINTMGAIFAICAPDDILSRFDLAGLLIQGGGTPRIYEKAFDYGQKFIKPMTGGIVDFYINQERLI